MRSVYEIYIIDPETDDWWKLAPVIAKDAETARLKAFFKAKEFEGNPRLTKDPDHYKVLVTCVGSLNDKLASSNILLNTEAGDPCRNIIGGSPAGGHNIIIGNS